MKGTLEVCYHKTTERKEQKSKALANFTTNNEEKSFHLDFEYNKQKYTLNLYHDCFGINRKLDNGEDGEFICYEEIK